MSLFDIWVDKIERDFFGVKKGVKLESIEMEGLLTGEVRAVVEEMAIQKQKLPQEPSINKNTAEIIPEKTGCIVDINRSVENVLEAGENEIVKLVFAEIKSTHTSKELANANISIGAYQSYIYGSAERLKNINIAAAGINNTVIWPGEIFSFNQITGPRNAANGYLPAPIIISGESEMGYGGGVCQVSSTLYNAVLSANLPVIERHGHSKAVHYVPAGRDATVDYGYLDFKFLNSLSGPLIVKASVSNAKVCVEILGRGK